MRVWGDNQRASSAEVIVFSRSLSMRIWRIFKIWDGRQIVLVEIKKSLCGGRKK